MSWIKNAWEDWKGKSPDRKKLELLPKDESYSLYRKELEEKVALSNLYSNPALTSFIKSEAPWDLDLIICELSELGIYTITNDTELDTYACHLKISILDKEVTGSGSTLLLASMRCLMEASYLINKQVNNILIK